MDISLFTISAEKGKRVSWAIFIPLDISSKLRIMYVSVCHFQGGSVNTKTTKHEQLWGAFNSGADPGTKVFSVATHANVRLFKSLHALLVFLLEDDPQGSCLTSW